MFCSNAKRKSHLVVPSWWMQAEKDEIIAGGKQNRVTLITRHWSSGSEFVDLPSIPGLPWWHGREVGSLAGSRGRVWTRYKRTMHPRNDLTSRSSKTDGKETNENKERILKIWSSPRCATGNQHHGKLVSHVFTRPFLSNSNTWTVPQFLPIEALKAVTLETLKAVILEAQTLKAILGVKLCPHVHASSENKISRARQPGEPSGYIRDLAGFGSERHPSKRIRKQTSWDQYSVQEFPYRDTWERWLLNVSTISRKWVCKFSRWEEKIDAQGSYASMQESAGPQPPPLIRYPRTSSAHSKNTTPNLTGQKGIDQTPTTAHTEKISWGIATRSQIIESHPHRQRLPPERGPTIVLLFCAPHPQLQ